MTTTLSLEEFLNKTKETEGQSLQDFLSNLGPTVTRKRIFTEQLFDVVGYKTGKDEPFFTKNNIGKVSAKRWQKTIRKMGCYRVDILEVSSKAHGKDLVFTEKNYIEKNVSKFTPGTPVMTEQRIQAKRIENRAKVLANMAKKAKSIETRSDANEVQIFAKVNNNLIFKGTEEEAVQFIIRTDTKINEVVIYVGGKLYQKIIRAQGE